jgi:hypothetical protein
MYVEATLLVVGAVALLYLWSEKRSFEEKYYAASRKADDRENILYNIREYVKGGECFLGAVHYTMTKQDKIQQANYGKEQSMLGYPEWTAPYLDLAGFSVKVASIFGKKPCGKCDGCKYFLDSYSGSRIKGQIIDVKFFGRSRND